VFVPGLCRARSEAGDVDFGAGEQSAIYPAIEDSELNSGDQIDEIEVYSSPSERLMASSGRAIAIVDPTSVA